MVENDEACNEKQTCEAENNHRNVVKHSGTSDSTGEVVDPPRALCKGKDHVGGRVLFGDVDLECIFKLLMIDIPDEMTFKQDLAEELAAAVDCRVKNITVCCRKRKSW